MGGKVWGLAPGHAPPPQDHHVDTPRPLPGGAGPATLGSLHHLECWQAGPLALPQPDRQSTAQGGVPHRPVPHVPLCPVPLLSPMSPPSPRLASCDPRWWPFATWTRRRSGRASTATRALRCAGAPGAPPRRPDAGADGLGLSGSVQNLPWERPPGPRRLQAWQAYCGAPGPYVVPAGESCAPSALSAHPSLVLWRREGARLGPAPGRL